MDILWFGNVSRIERGQNGSNPHSRIYRHIGHIPFLQDTSHSGYMNIGGWRVETSCNGCGLQTSVLLNVFTIVSIVNVKTTNLPVTKSRQFNR